MGGCQTHCDTLPISCYLKTMYNLQKFIVTSLTLVLLLHHTLEDFTNDNSGAIYKDILVLSTIPTISMNWAFDYVIARHKTWKYNIVTKKDFSPSSPSTPSHQSKNSKQQYLSGIKSDHHETFKKNFMRVLQDHLTLQNFPNPQSLQSGSTYVIQVLL